MTPGPTVPPPGERLYATGGPAAGANRQPNLHLNASSQVGRPDARSRRRRRPGPGPAARRLGSNGPAGQPEGPGARSDSLNTTQRARGEIFKLSPEQARGEIFKLSLAADSDLRGAASSSYSRRVTSRSRSRTLVTGTPRRVLVRSKSESACHGDRATEPRAPGAGLFPRLAARHKLPQCLHHRDKLECGSEPCRARAREP